jgi:hypothetical protein
MEAVYVMGGYFCNFRSDVEPRIPRMSRHPGAMLLELGDLRTPKACWDISQAYAFFAYAWSVSEAKNRTLDGCRGFLARIRGGVWTLKWSSHAFSVRLLAGGADRWCAKDAHYRLIYCTPSACKGKLPSSFPPEHRTGRTHRPNLSR